MANGMGLTDLTAFVSFAGAFGDSLDTETQVETNSNKSPKISRQQSRIGIFHSKTHSGAATPSGGGGEGKRINDLQMTEKEKQELMHTKTFRRIQQDIKDRQKRQKINAEKEKLEAKDEEKQVEQQFYIDKDKQIVCAQGADDLKGKILKQRGSGKKSGESDILMSLFILVRQAEHEMKNGDPNVALAYLERGIRIRPQHTELLVLKCRCLVEMSRFKEALVDADLILQNNRALNPNKNFSMTIQHQTAVAYHVKGDALYNLGNFEHALVNYHRANKYTLKREKARLYRRITRTERAILNVVGPAAEQYFHQIGNFLNKLPKNVSGITLKNIKSVNVKEDPELAAKQDKAKDKKFLCELACDKEYLEDMLVKLSTHTHANKLDFHKDLASKAEEALNYLKERKEFWAQQQPEQPEFPEDIGNLQHKSSWNTMINKVEQNEN